MVHETQFVHSNSSCPSQANKAINIEALKDHTLKHALEIASTPYEPLTKIYLNR